MRNARAGSLAVGLLCCLSASLRGQEAAAPPIFDTRAFLDEVRANITSDATLLDQYTFTEEFTEKHFDGKGAVKKAKVEAYEVYPSFEPGKMYRRLVARDGKALSAEELAESDRKQEEKVAKRERRRAEEDDAARQKRLEKKARRLEEERRVVDELFLMDEITVAGRETMDGRPTIIVDFAPKPGYRPVTGGGKVLQKIAGRAWIDEEDRQLVRIELRLLDSLGVGPVRVVRLQKGAHGYFQRRKVNGEIWLPAEAQFSGTARILLIFGGPVEITSRYSDYRKFSVGTDERITVAPE